MRRLVPWVPVAVWALLIFWLSATPELRFVPDARLDLIVRKLGHMGVFGTLALLLWSALATTTAARPAVVWAAVLALAYAASDEFHQGFTPGRDPSVRDVLIDGLGIVVALVLGRLILAWRARRSR